MNTASGPKARILVVDRNEDLRELFSYFLELKGFEVQDAPCGTIALVCAASFVPDAVFSSLRIGECDGFTLAKELRKLPQTANTLLVAMSAYAHERAAAYEAGFDHYLAKPIAFESMMAIIMPLEADVRRRFRGMP
jgi:CheY-like chemotaxis protein